MGAPVPALPVVRLLPTSAAPTLPGVREPRAGTGGRERSRRGVLRHRQPPVVGRRHRALRHRAGGLARAGGAAPHHQRRGLRRPTTCTSACRCRWPSSSATRCGSPSSSRRPRDRLRATLDHLRHRPVGHRPSSVPHRARPHHRGGPGGDRRCRAHHGRHRRHRHVPRIWRDRRGLLRPRHPRGAGRAAPGGQLAHRRPRGRGPARRGGQRRDGRGGGPGPPRARVPHRHRGLRAGRRRASGHRRAEGGGSAARPPRWVGRSSGTSPSGPTRPPTGWRSSPSATSTSTAPPRSRWR